MRLERRTATSLAVFVWLILGNARAHASGSGDWSEVGASLARMGGAVLPEGIVRWTDDGVRGGVAWEFPLVLTACDPRWCRRSGSELDPKSNTQWSTVPAFRWYPWQGEVGGRITERFWLFGNGSDWNPGAALGAGWFFVSDTHGPTIELRLWLGDVMFGSTTRGRSAGFFLGLGLERPLSAGSLHTELCAGIEAPIYVEL